MSNSTLLPENSITFLPISICALIDVSLQSGIDCSRYNQTQCIGCLFVSRFFSGEKTNDTRSLSHFISIILCLITLIIGIFAMLGNIVIIAVIKKRQNKHAFDGFLMALAVYDFTCSLFAILSSTSSIIYLREFHFEFKLVF